MPQLQYVGLSHFREISKKDLTAALTEREVSTEGLELSAISVAREDTDKSWNPKRVKSTVEVPQEVVDLLTDAEPNDWKVVDDAKDFQEPAPADPQNTPNDLDNPAVGTVTTDTTTGPTGGGATSTRAAGRR